MFSKLRFGYYKVEKWVKYVSNRGIQPALWQMETMGPDVSLDEELIEILASLDCGKTRLQPAFRWMLPVPLLFLSLSSGAVVPRTFPDPLANAPITVPCSPQLMLGAAPLCETQLPDGIHFIPQKDQPQGKLGSPGTLLAKVRLSNIAQTEPWPGPPEVHRDKRRNKQHKWPLWSAFTYCWSSPSTLSPFSTWPAMSRLRCPPVSTQAPPQQVPVSCLCQETQGLAHQGPTTPVWHSWSSLLCLVQPGKSSWPCLWSTLLLPTALCGKG